MSPIDCFLEENISNRWRNIIGFINSKNALGTNRISSVSRLPFRIFWSFTTHSRLDAVLDCSLQSVWYTYINLSVQGKSWSVCPLFPVQYIFHAGIMIIQNKCFLYKSGREWRRRAQGKKCTMHHISPTWYIAGAASAALQWLVYATSLQTTGEATTIPLTNT